MTTLEILQRAKKAKSAMALAKPDAKNRALSAMARALEDHATAILTANALDLEAAKGAVSEVMLDRLALSPDRIAGMAEGVRQVAALPDPVGQVLRREERPNGLVIEKTAVPMGVIAIIYESRPNVTSDTAALALKLATKEEIETIKAYAFKVNEVLKEYFLNLGVRLIDFKLEFGRLSDGTIVLADEISPDTCRFWDAKTGEKLDKDRFRRDMGGVEDAYKEIFKRVASGD